MPPAEAVLSTTSATLKEPVWPMSVVAPRPEFHPMPVLPLMLGPTSLDNLDKIQIPINWPGRFICLQKAMDIHTQTLFIVRWHWICRELIKSTGPARQFNQNLWNSLLVSKLDARHEIYRGRLDCSRITIDRIRKVGGKHKSIARVVLIRMRDSSRIARLKSAWCYCLLKPNGKPELFASEKDPVMLGPTSRALQVWETMHPFQKYPEPLWT